MIKIKHLCTFVNSADWKNQCILNIGILQTIAVSIVPTVFGKKTLNERGHGELGSMLIQKLYKPIESMSVRSWVFPLFNHLLKQNN